MKGQLRIDEIFAIIAIDRDGTEGIPAYSDPFGMMMPLVGADPQRLESYKELARTMPEMSGMKMRVCRFTNREELGVIDRTHENQG
jgi:hypothetical protein